MPIEKIHHVAYRCKNAKETVEWYQKHLEMPYILAFAEDQVPSTKEPDPYMHVFLDAGNGNVLAFFELPTQPDMDRDRNTPEWVQHIAFQVSSMDDLTAAKKRLEDAGIDVPDDALPTLDPIGVLFVMEMIGLGALVWAFRRFRLDEPARRQAFLREGRLSRDLMDGPEPTC